MKNWISFAGICIALSACGNHSSSLVTITVDTGLKTQSTHDLMQGLVHANIASAPTTCLQNNVIVAYGLANGDSNDLTTAPVTLVTPIITTQPPPAALPVIDYLWLSENANVSTISVTLPSSQTYNVGVGGSIVQPLFARADGTCATEDATGITEIATTALLGYASVAAAADTVLPLNIWVAPPATALPSPVPGSVCQQSNSGNNNNDQYAQQCPNNNFYEVYCPSCGFSGYSLRLNYFYSNNGNAPVTQNFPSTFFAAGSPAPLIPNIDPVQVSVLSAGQIVGSQTYTSNHNNSSSNNSNNGATNIPGTSNSNLNSNNNVLNISVVVNGIASVVPVTIQNATEFASQLVVTGPNVAATGICTAYTVTVTDGNGNAVAGANSIGVSLNMTSSPNTNSATFCGGMPVTIPAGASSATFSIIDNTPESFTINAASTGLAAAARPVQLKTAVSVSAGTSHTCATIYDGTNFSVECWGNNLSGQLGNNSSPRSSIPMTVPNLGGSTVPILSAGSNFNCAIQSGQVYCWGGNDSGQLGNGMTGGIYPQPTLISSLSGANEIAASGSGHFACAALSTGVRCWGDNTFGQLGNGSSYGANNSQSAPVQVSSISNPTSLVAAANSACVLTNSGTTTECWGDNTYGQLGIGVTPPPGLEVAPTTVSSLGTLTTLSGSAFGNHVCVLVGGSTLKCWGKNDSGQLASPAGGIISMPATGNVPAAVNTLATGYDFTCGLEGTASAVCWGDNLIQQLGSGSNVLNSATAMPVIGLPNGPSITQISAGFSHACAIVGGGIFCWGSNINGELGNGTFSTSSTAVPVAIQ